MEGVFVEVDACSDMLASGWFRVLISVWSGDGSEFN